MEDNKYYTPDIEEFHVGFECEIKTISSDGDGGWGERIITIDDFYPPVSHLECSLIEAAYWRVKHLDQEDIESLGFELAWNEWDEHSYTNGELLLQFNPSGHEYRLYVASEMRFKGTVKNKAELKKVLKMIGYGIN